MVNRIFDRMLAALAVVAAVITLYLVLSVDFEVIMRYVFNRPTRWVVDFTEYALVYILFLAMAWALSREGHVKVDILLSMLPARKQRMLNIITSVAGAVGCAVFFWVTMWMTLDAFREGILLLRATIVPRGPIWMVMPIGSFFLTIQFVRRAWVFARGAAPADREKH